MGLASCRATGDANSRHALWRCASSLPPCGRPSLYFPLISRNDFSNVCRACSACRSHHALSRACCASRCLASGELERSDGYMQAASEGRGSRVGMAHLTICVCERTTQHPVSKHQGEDQPLSEPRTLGLRLEPARMAQGRPGGGHRRDSQAAVLSRRDRIDAGSRLGSSSWAVRRLRSED